MQKWFEITKHNPKKHSSRIKTNSTLLNKNNIAYVLLLSEKHSKLAVVFKVRNKVPFGRLSYCRGKDDYVMFSKGFLNESYCCRMTMFGLLSLSRWSISPKSGNFRWSSWYLCEVGRPCSYCTPWWRYLLSVCLFSLWTHGTTAKEFL